MEPAEAYAELIEELRADPAFSVGQMMGRPTLKVGKKIFGGLRDDELLIKIGHERTAELLASGRARPFDPSRRGREMRGWVLVGEPTEEWLAFAEEAKLFTASG